MEDEATYPYDVFISYRWITPDQEWVREQLYPALVNAGLKVCLDVEDFVPGRDLILEMERAGLESRRVICVVSPEYFEDGRMVEFESLLFQRHDLAGRYSRLIPLVLRETKIPERIRGLIPVSWVSAIDHGREWKKLLKVLVAPSLESPPPNALYATEPSQLAKTHSPQRPLLEKPLPSSQAPVAPDAVEQKDKGETERQPATAPTLKSLLPTSRDESQEPSHVVQRAIEVSHSPVLMACEYGNSMKPVPARGPWLYMAPCLVSNELYYRFVSESPYWRTAEYDADSSYLKHWRNDGPQNAERWSPVTNVSFRAAKAFAGWLSKLTSRHMRLPKLEEWQLAARAGRDHWFEDEVAAGRVNYFDTSRRMSTVESFGSNPYGIRDLIGQAFDMCSLDDALLRPAIVGGCSHNTLKQLRDALQGEEINSDKTCLPDVSFRCVRSA